MEKTKLRFKVSFVWSLGVEVIEASDITQAKRIASRRYGKMNVRHVWQAGQAK